MLSRGLIKVSVLAAAAAGLMTAGSLHAGEVGNNNSAEKISAVRVYVAPGGYRHPRYYRYDRRYYGPRNQNNNYYYKPYGYRYYYPDRHYYHRPIRHHDGRMRFYVR